MRQDTKVTVKVQQCQKREQAVAFSRKIPFLISILPISAVCKKDFKHFLLQQSSTTETSENKHPRPAEKLLCTKFYWDKPQQEKKLCGTQRARSETWVINIWVEFTVQQQYKRCWTPPLWNAPSLTQARQAANLRKDWCAASKITHGMRGMLSSLGWIAKALRQSLTGKDGDAFAVRAHSKSAACERQNPLAKAYITPLCIYNMENTSCILNF